MQCQNPEHESTYHCQENEKYGSPDGLPVQFDHVHNLDRVVCILLAQEFYKPVALHITH